MIALTRSAVAARLRAPPMPSLPPEPPGDESTPASIWLVDDSPLEAAISKRGLGTLHVVVFHDGSSALERLTLADEHPDMILLDWHMPDMSGLDVCRAVRARFDSAELPILILTGSDSHQDLLEGLEAGANDFLRKPFDNAELNARVAALVRSKRLHQRMRHLEAALRDEANFREQFLAILAHDLRQPLNALTLGTFTIASPTTTPEARENVAASMTRASARMARMIGELLDFTRARPSGGMPIRTEEARLDVVAVVEQIRLEHPARTIDLSVDGTCVGTWDPDRLAQVVSNLVENALANSPSDTPVALRIKTRDGRIELTVENRGVTIPPEILAGIFDPFRERRPKPSGGLGLGLFIIAQIVRAHRGTIAAASADGVTTFEVSLPCDVPAV